MKRDMRNPERVLDDLRSLKEQAIEIKNARRGPGKVFDYMLEAVIALRMAIHHEEKRQSAND